MSQIIFYNYTQYLELIGVFTAMATLAMTRPTKSSSVLNL
jgi:hypothetical protein